MWKKTHVDVGAHGAKYAGFVLKALGKKLRRPEIPKDYTQRAGLLLDLMGVVATLNEDLALERNLPRVLVGVCRVIHESLALLGRLGLTEEQINALVATALDDEMRRVDPSRGLLDENSGKPYMFGSAVQDPPDFEPFWLDGIVSKLRKVGKSTDSIDSA